MVGDGEKNVDKLWGKILIEILRLINCSENLENNLIEFKLICVIYNIIDFKDCVYKID